jgi:hypothetical protein
MQEDRKTIKAILKKQSIIPGLKGGMTDLFDRLQKDLDRALP